MIQDIVLKVSESGFYYLQSRYYDPNIGRFINADREWSFALTTGLNMFSYCINSPIVYNDPTGNKQVLGIDASSGATNMNTEWVRAVSDYKANPVRTALSHSEYSQITYNGNSVEIYAQFNSSKYAEELIQSLVIPVDTPISDFLSASTGMGAILSYSLTKIRSYYSIPESFLGSQALATAGASDLVAGVMLGYSFAAYIYNQNKENEADLYIKTIERLNTDRISVTCFVWDTGNVSCLVGTW